MEERNAQRLRGFLGLPFNEMRKSAKAANDNILERAGNSKDSLFQQSAMRSPFDEHQKVLPCILKEMTSIYFWINDLSNTDA